MNNLLLLLHILFMSIHTIYAMDNPNQLELKKKEKKTFNVPRLSLGKKHSHEKKGQSASSLSDDNDFGIIPKIEQTTLAGSNNTTEATKKKIRLYSSSGSPRKRDDITIEKPSKSTNYPKHLTPIIAHQHPDFFSHEEKTGERQKKTNPHSASHSPRKELCEQHQTIEPEKGLFKLSPRERQKKTSSPRKDTHILTDFESILNAIRQENISLINTFLNDLKNNPNEVKEQTLLHHAVLNSLNKNNVSIVTLFLLCPNVCSLIKNLDGRAPYEFITKEDIAKHGPLLDLLRSRATLDRIIHALLITDKKLINEPTENIIHAKTATLLQRICSTVIPSYADHTFIFKMISSRLKHDSSSLIKEYNLYQKNPNHEDEHWKCTLLHHATYLRDIKKIKKLVENPTIVSRPNSEGFRPQALIYSLEKGPTIEEIRQILFHRDTIDFLIEKEVEGLLLTNPLVSTLKINDACFNNIKKLMEEHFKALNTAQEGDSTEDHDRMLPANYIKFPSFVNDAFLVALFHTHMKRIKITNTIELKDFNPDPTFTESSESKNSEQNPISSNTQRHILLIEEKIKKEKLNNTKPK